jgi:hypothetical protein
MAENRLTRELDTRVTEERPKQWLPPELLPEPDKQAGFEYRWVRVSLNNQADPRNVSAMIRQGWEPVKVEEQPKFKLLVDPNSRYKDGVEIGGLLLCKIPEELVQQRKEYYSKQTQAQADAVDSSLMRQSDARMPLFAEKKSEVRKFGKG